MIQILSTKLKILKTTLSELLLKAQGTFNLTLRLLNESINKVKESNKAKKLGENLSNDKTFKSSVNNVSSVKNTSDKRMLDLSGNNFNNIKDKESILKSTTPTKTGGKPKMGVRFSEAGRYFNEHVGKGNEFDVGTTKKTETGGGGTSKKGGPNSIIKDLINGGIIE